MKKYITTPIYYVNDLPHIGHAYTTIAADILARFYRLYGEEVFFVTGTDEHGAKISEAALQRGMTAKEFCDEISSKFRSTWDQMKIKYDYFIRTTDITHIRCVQEILQKLYDRNYIVRGYYEGLYCTGCEKFLAEDELLNGLCPDHQKKPEIYREENYFFKLSYFRDKLVEIITDKNSPYYMEILPVSRRNEILGKLKIGLEDICISRSKLHWGIPLPFDETQTVYVWIDALINYISAVSNGASASSQFSTLRLDDRWPPDCHLMAKDILWFHAVIWPAILMALDLPPPRRLFAHGFFTIDGQKMSKTLGNIITPLQMTEKFGVDATRYLLLALFPFGADGDISWSVLCEKYNTDLANNLGNLVNRTLTMVEKYFNGIIPPESEISRSEEFSIMPQLGGIENYIKNFEFHNAISAIQSAIDAANRYIEEKSPWEMHKKNDARLAGVMRRLLESLGLLAISLQVFMPEISQKIWESLNAAKSLKEATTEFFGGKIDFLSCNVKVKKTEILFPRV